MASLVIGPGVSIGGGITFENKPEIIIDYLVVAGGGAGGVAGGGAGGYRHYIFTQSGTLSW